MKRLLHVRQKKLGEKNKMSEKDLYEYCSREVCRAILDRHDVLKSQVINQVIESLRNAQANDEQISQAKNDVEHIIQRQYNGLVDQVISLFSRQK